MQRLRIGRGVSRLMGTAAALVSVSLAGSGGAALAQSAPQPAAQKAPEPRSDGNWQYYPRAPKAPAGAPNVLLVLTDDVGFGASSTFGGPIPTPTFDMLARNGLRYTQFHTTAMCSPTRASLLTGRDHHAVSSGSLSNVSVDEPGYTSVIPDSAATIGRVLRDNGYDTAWFGKNHNTPDWELGPMGPFKHWPTGMGFDYFYGFNSAGTDQVNPPLYENNRAVRRDPKDTSYIADRDLADKMLDWMGAQHALNPDKPFFMYYAPGAMHGPQQAPKAWIDKFKGKFDQGWDAMRDEILARQKRLGVIPKNTKMAPPLRDVPAWNTLSADQKRLYTRMMEAAAAQLAYMDDQFGRVMQRLKDSGQLDNTLVIFIQGDNGAALHNMNGSINAYSMFAGIKETDEFLMKRYDDIGTERSMGNYPVGFAYATNTPYPWGKTVASQLGGLRDGMVISWPKKITDKGGIRPQFGHVNDIAPTIYEAIGITPPDTVDGVKQQPFDGVSLRYTFDNAKAPTRHREQYFEMLGSRGFYKDGWFAGTEVNWDPWGPNKSNPYAAKWELYNLNVDYAQTQNVAAKYPEKLAELQAGFEAAAKKNHIYPLSADFFERINFKYRPTGMGPATTRVFYPSDFRYPPTTFPELTPTFKAVAKVKINAAGDSGPILVQGNKFAGFALRLDDGVPVFVYDPSGRQEERHTLRGAAALGPGEHEIVVGFTPQGRGATVTLTIDGAVAGTSVVPRVIGILAGEALIGRPAIDDLTGPTKCGCEIRSVTITEK